MLSGKGIPRRIETIYMVIDGYPDIVFDQEEPPKIETSQPRFLRPYQVSTISAVFRAMGCHLPLNNSMAEWMFTFLRECPAEGASQILGTPPDFFDSTWSYSPKNAWVKLNRTQFHRLVCAALHVHQFRKVRYCVDFRLALDFIEDRRFFIVLLSGAPGTGKSTMASLIASRMSVNHILSTDSIRHAMRTFYSQKEYPILYKSTYECGDLIDPNHELETEERCIKGYMAQSDLVGTQLVKIIESFVKSRASLIIEGVHLSIDLMLKIVKQFPNVVPFLIYIKKEDFHKQRFAVRAKYMTTDPTMNKYIGNFTAIRAVQGYLSKGASQFLVPKIDNRNIDRSMETMHQTLFSYLKKLEGRGTMFDPETQRLTFLDSVWKRRKQKIASKAKTLKTIRALKNSADTEAVPKPESAMAELLKMLPKEGEKLVSEDLDGEVIEYLQNGTMLMTHERVQPPPPEPPEEPVPEEDRPEEDVCEGPDSNPLFFADTETENDPAEVTLTDFMETTDSEVVDWKSLIAKWSPVAEQSENPIDQEDV